MMRERQRKIEVILADDHPGVRAGIRSMLRRNPDIVVVAEASDGKEALQLVEKYSPDVLLLDVEMPLMDGREVAEEIKQRNLEVSVLAVSSYDDQQYIQGMLNSGASGYITKDEVPALLVDAVIGVAEGEEGWVSKRVSNQIASQASGSSWEQQTLTKREYDVLKLLKEKKTDEAIAEILGTDIENIARHVARLKDKYSVSTRAELIVKATQQH